MAHLEPTCVPASSPPRPSVRREAVWHRAAQPRDDVAAAAVAAEVSSDAADCAAGAALLQAYIRAVLRTAACHLLRVPWPVSVRAAAPPSGVREPPGRLAQPSLPPASSMSWRSRASASAPPRGDPRCSMPQQHECIDRVAGWRTWVDSGDPPHADGVVRMSLSVCDAPSIFSRERAERRCASSDPPTRCCGQCTAVRRCAERAQVSVCRSRCRCSRDRPPDRSMSRGRYRPPPERWLRMRGPGHKPPWRRHAVGPPSAAWRERSRPMREDP